MNADVPDILRLFFAIWPNAAVAQKLHAVAFDRAGRQGGRAMRLETLHLTLAFLGDVSSSRLEIAQAAGDAIKAKPFLLLLDRLHYWRHNRLLWAGCNAENPGLSELAANLRTRLGQSGFTLEERSFVPHVTLVRNATLAAFDEMEMPEIEWECDSFALVRSVSSPAGTIYRRLSDWRLDH